MNRVDKLILSCLKDKKEKRTSEIAKSIDRQIGGFFYSLKNLMNEKCIRQIDYGVYQITEIGIKTIELEELKEKLR
ncbi:MAG: hypothetical protein ACOC56_04710 [Atribacterota bacterium]